MKISELYKTAIGQVVYIVGTGPSMRVFPKEFLIGRKIIGCNQAWRHCKPDVNLTVHPELILDQKREENKKRSWATKAKPPLDGLTEASPDIYVFRTSTEVEVLCTQPKDTLYLGHGIQCTAIDLAVRMGARAIFMVGCDMNDLGGDHHGHSQHVRFHGLPPKDVYEEYRRFTAKVRRIVRDRFKIPVLTLSPFLGQNAAGEDYQRLVAELNLPALPPPADTSAYNREKTDP